MDKIQIDSWYLRCLLTHLFFVQKLSSSITVLSTTGIEGGVVILKVIFEKEFTTSNFIQLKGLGGRNCLLQTHVLLRLVFPYVSQIITSLINNIIVDIFQPLKLSQS